MSTPVLTGLITLGGVVFTALASYLIARQRVREIVVQYEQRLQSEYLENARLYTNSIYVPLSTALVELRLAYERFLPHIDFDAGTSGEAERTQFRGAAMAFVAQTKDLSRRGADAFLTTELEEALTTFRAFLEDSVDALEQQEEIVVRLALPLNLFLPGGIGVPVLRFRLTSPSSRLRAVIAGASTMFFTTESAVIRAPVDSRPFQEKFAAYARVVSVLVKQVTLGAHARPR